MKTHWYKKKEYWGLAGIIGAVLTAIPGTQIVGVAITAGVGAGMYYFGVKDGEKNNTPSAISFRK
jgi:hypothetical protein